MNAQNILKNTIDINDFYLNVLLKKYDKNSASGKKSIVADFSSFYFKITNEITKNHYLKRMSETLNIDEDVLKKMLSGKDNFPLKERSTPKTQAIDAQKEIETKNNNFSRLKEASLLAILLRSNLDIIKPIVLELPSNYVENTELRSILEKLQEYLHELEPLKFEISEFLKLLNPDTVNVAKDLLLLDLGLEMGKRDEVLIEAQNLSNFIKKEYLRKQIKQISNQIKIAEKENNLDKVKNLTEEFLNLSKLL